MNPPSFSGSSSRKVTVDTLVRIADPLLIALSEGQLKLRLPIEAGEGNLERRSYAHLEALGRLLAGIGPWLELGPDETEEGQIRGRLGKLAVKAISSAVNPSSPDYMNFDHGSQPLVDAAFLAHGLLRAPHQLWGKLDDEDHLHLISALKLTRAITPGRNNWLLFSALIEASLWHFTGQVNLAPIEMAVEEHLAWYVGDGTYGDGPHFRWDYYNTFVIQPMLLDVVRICAEKKHPLGKYHPLVLERARRHAVVQERLISPEATFPILGRSSCYRFGSFQTLSQMALIHQLPAELSKGAVRGALTAIIQRMIEAPGTFDANGWLRLGVAGYQPAQAESYISTGSLYLCSVGLLHLGLSAEDSFWMEQDEPWTQQKIWTGENIPRDQALTA